MTEQEAAALAARLKRVWQPESEISWILREEDDDFHHSFEWKGDFADGIHIQVEWVGWCGLYANLESPASEDGYFLLNFYQGRLEVRSSIGKDHDWAKIAAQWLPFFRRCCWLSGISHKATAQERIEWVQGFTSEEIEAWNLKI